MWKDSTPGKLVFNRAVTLADTLGEDAAKGVVSTVTILRPCLRFGLWTPILEAPQRPDE